MLHWLRSIIGAPDAAGTRPRLERRVSECLDQLEALARDVKSLRLEWEETYESVNRALRKMAKREKRAEEGCVNCQPSGEELERVAGNGGRLSVAEQGALLRAARARYGT